MAVAAVAVVATIEVMKGDEKLKKWKKSGAQPASQMGPKNECGFKLDGPHATTENYRYRNEIRKNICIFTRV